MPRNSFTVPAVVPRTGPSLVGTTGEPPEPEAAVAVPALAAVTPVPEGQRGQRRAAGGSQPGTPPVDRVHDLGSFCLAGWPHATVSPGWPPCHRLIPPLRPDPADPWPAHGWRSPHARRGTADRGGPAAPARPGHRGAGSRRRCLHRDPVSSSRPGQQLAGIGITRACPATSMPMAGSRCTGQPPITQRQNCIALLTSRSPNPASVEAQTWCRGRGADRQIWRGDLRAAVARSDQRKSCTR